MLTEAVNDLVRVIMDIRQDVTPDTLLLKECAIAEGSRSINIEV
jgi:hypothetical protein